MVPNGSSPEITFAKVIRRPRLCVVMDVRRILCARDLVHRKRCRIAQELTRRRQVVPERHFSGAPAASCEIKRSVICLAPRKPVLQ